MEERILTGLFLCSADENEILSGLKPQWAEKTGLSLQEKLGMLNYTLASVFPWRKELSTGTDYEPLCASFFARPDVFLRLRPDGYASFVKEKLERNNIQYKLITEDCIAFPSASKISDVLALDYEAMIQDMNSQRTGEFMKLAVQQLNMPFISAWDCCSGSGGKSLLLYDIYQQLDLTVSDSRESILKNLEKRFKEHEIVKYETIVADLGKQTAKFSGNSKFSLIICDAPCTGSGTWARTPEQLYYFDEKKIDEYALLQKKIISNTIPQLNPGGFFLYITCSVFKKENEEAVDFIKQKFHLNPIKIELLKGYDKKADTMFAALLQKPL